MPLLARFVDSEGDYLGLKEVNVFLASRIGDPVDSPCMSSVKVLPESGRDIGEAAGK